MDAKAEWLFTRKQQIIAQLSECEAQSKDIIVSLASANDTKAKEIQALRQANKKSEATFKEEIGKCLMQLKTYENMIITKEDTIAELRQQNQQLSASNDERSVLVQQNYAHIIELQHLLSVQKQQSDKIKSYCQREIQLRQGKYLEEIARMKRQFDEQLSARQAKLVQSHQQELSEIKRNNLQLVHKIQSQYQAMSSKTLQSNKQAEFDCSRLIAENTKLLQIVNENKLKILTLESSLNSQQQQVKIQQKEMQILKDNNRRQCTFLKEEKVSLAEKNKKLNEKIEELTWKNRESELKKEEELKRIRKQVDQSFQQILHKAQEENRKMENINEQLKKQLQEKGQQLQQMQQISLRIKDLYETQQKELYQLKQEKEMLQRNAKQTSEVNLAKANEDLRNEMVRKNCQIGVLQDEVKRLKAKVNSVAAAQQQFTKHKEVIENQNKMLLSQIIFLREKEKKGRNKLHESKLNRSNFLSEMNSDASKDYEDIEEYKKIIEYMTNEMNDVSKKIIEKDNKIEKLQALVRRYERELKELR